MDKYLNAAEFCLDRAILVKASVPPTVETWDAGPLEGQPPKVAATAPAPPPAGWDAGAGRGNAPRGRLLFPTPVKSSSKRTSPRRAITSSASAATGTAAATPGGGAGAGGGAGGAGGRGAGRTRRTWSGTRTLLLLGIQNRWQAHRQARHRHCRFPATRSFRHRKPLSKSRPANTSSRSVSSTGASKEESDAATAAAQAAATQAAPGKRASPGTAGTWRLLARGLTVAAADA